MNKPNSPFTENELHALVDGQLTVERRHELEAWLSERPDEAQRVADYRAQKRALRALFDPVLDETVPPPLQRAALPERPWYLQRLAAGLVIALLGGVAGWALHGRLAPAQQLALAPSPDDATPYDGGFAHRAAVAHAVYSPDQRRPVEVDAAHEDQLVAWLSKRMGSPMRPPRLQTLGYALEGGRLLPGGQGPVAQFMYRDEAGGRLTLYVSNEGSSAAKGRKEAADTAFRFVREGSVNVFYWVDGPFGYALSADADRAALARVSSEVYRQLLVP
jgi:anti-sigma factor RsiW